MTVVADEREATRFARHLFIQAGWTLALVSAALAALPLAFGAGPYSPAIAAILALATLLGLATLALSTLILFDALLFRLIASHDRDEAGCAAVDAFLARTRLKPAAPRNRPLTERISGTRRLLVRQRVACFFFLATVAAAWFAQRL